jgi:endoglucanase
MMNKSSLVLALSILVVPQAAHAGDANVRVNSIGYVPQLVKFASVNVRATDFQVKRPDGSVAFAGKLVGPKKGSDSVDTTWIADFSPLVDAGTYYVDVPGVGRSVNFAIGKDVFREAFVVSMLGIYGQRCNADVSLTFHGQKYAHKACHMDDARTDDIATIGGRNGKKGWHDAGDYNKYVVNAGVTVGGMLQAWEDFGQVLKQIALPIPEAGGALPDYLDEIKYELEWLLTMQYGPTDGRVSAKVSARDFDSFEMPERERSPRYFVPWGSAATADFVGILAKAARVYRQAGDTVFADKCLAAAKVSYEFLVRNPKDHAADQSGFNTGGYTTGDSDDRLWAAAEMWETTGDVAALADFEGRAKDLTKKVDPEFDWSNVKNLGSFVYLRSPRPGRNSSLVKAFQTDLAKAADKLVASRDASAYGRALPMYAWGSSGSVVRACMVLQTANFLAPNPLYLDTCADQVAWVFGRNQYNRSQVTGLGINPPMNPHHRPSGADGIKEPWPGLLVGGGHGPTDWVDVQASYQTNEIAINWNAALVYALAGLLPADNAAVAWVNRPTPRVSGGGCGALGAAHASAPFTLLPFAGLAAVLHRRRRR